MSIENHFEKEPIRVDRIAFTLQDIQDVHDVHVETDQLKDPENFVAEESDIENYKEDIEDGYIFRRANKAIGYIEIAPPESEDVLYIEHVVVLPNERSAPMTKRIIDTIRALAQEQHKTKIEWLPTSDIMKGLTEKIGAESEENEYGSETFSIPVDSLSVETLISLARDHSQK